MHQDVRVDDRDIDEEVEQSHPPAPRLTAATVEHPPGISQINTCHVLVVELHGQRTRNILAPSILCFPGYSCVRSRLSNGVDEWYALVVLPHYALNRTIHHCADVLSLLQCLLLRLGVLRGSWPILSIGTRSCNVVQVILE